MFNQLVKGLKLIANQQKYCKQTKQKAFLRTEKQINDQLYDSIFKESNYRDQTKRKKIAQVRDKKEEEKQKRLIEKQIEQDQESMVLSKEELHRAISQVVKTPDQQLIDEIKQNNTFNEDLWQKTKKNIRMLPVESIVELSNVVRKASQQKYGPGEIQLSASFWSGLTEFLVMRKHQLSFQQIADLLWNYAYLNRKDNYFFKQMENELFEKEEELIPLHLVEKMLYGFSFSDTGSATIYNKLAKSIKIGQHEMPILQLARCAKYFSKASDNLKGGFGIYLIAEQQISKRMHELNFNECVRVSQQMISMNLGSNKFQKQLEDKLMMLFPHDISASHLVALCKAFSRHRFQEQGLLNKLQDISVNYLKEMSNQQILEVLWSFSRGGRGSVPLFQGLEQQILLRIKMYNLRAISFIIEGFSLVNYNSDVLMTEIQDRFNQLGEDNNKMNPHYVLKIVMALNRLEQTTSSFFKSILDSITKQELSSEQYIKLCYSIAKSEQRQFQQMFQQLLINGESHIQEIIQKQDVVQVSMLLFCYAQINYNNHVNIVVQALGDVNSVPKHLFTDCFYSLLALKQYKKAADFLPIVKSLGTFGEIKYFFDHDNFIRLVWCSFITQMYSQNQQLQDEFNIQLDQWHSFKESILDINPNTLKISTLKMWIEILSFISIFIEIDENLINSSLQEIEESSRQELLDTQNRIGKQAETKQLLYRLQSSITQYYQDTGISSQEYQLINNYTDKYSNHLDLAVIHNSVKIGVLIVDEDSYMTSEDNRQLLLPIDLMLRTLKYIYNWKLVIIDKQELEKGLDKEDTSFVEDKFRLTQGRKRRQKK